MNNSKLPKDIASLLNSPDAQRLLLSLQSLDEKKQEELKRLAGSLSPETLQNALSSGMKETQSETGAVLEKMKKLLEG